MKRGSVIAGIAAAALVTVAAVVWTAQEAPLVQTASESGDAVAGKTLYAQNCASCHGANLEGQENWRSPGPDGRLPAPPHDETGHTWHHPDSMLFAYTKQGGKAALAAEGVTFDSGMPGFADQLSDAEIRDIIAYIKSTWPEQIRIQQSDRTAAATE